MKQLKPKKATLLTRIILIVIINLLFGLLYALVPSFTNTTSQPSPIATAFSPPLGFRDGFIYAPRVMYVDIDNNGVLDLIENTNYGEKS